METSAPGPPIRCFCSLSVSTEISLAATWTQSRTTRDQGRLLDFYGTTFHLSRRLMMLISHGGHVVWLLRRVAKVPGRREMLPSWSLTACLRCRHSLRQARFLAPAEVDDVAADFGLWGFQVPFSSTSCRRESSCFSFSILCCILLVAIPSRASREDSDVALSAAERLHSHQVH